MSNKLKDFIKVSYLWSGILFVSSVFGLIGNPSGAAAAVYLAELVLSIGMWRATVGIRHSAFGIRLWKKLGSIKTYVVWGLLGEGGLLFGFTWSIL